MKGRNRWRNSGWVRVVAASVLLFLTVDCDRTPPPEPEPPIRQKLVGKWTSPTPITSATLDLNQDGSFRYTFRKGSNAPFVASGTWTLDEDSIIGLVQLVENGAYLKAGDTFAIGKVVSVENGELKLAKKTGTEVYHRP